MVIAKSCTSRRQNLSPQYYASIISQRETEVLYLIANEHTTEEIALLMHLSRHTVVSHRKNLMEKWKVRNVAGLIRIGFQIGLLN